MASLILIYVPSVSIEEPTAMLILRIYANLPES